MSTRTTRSMTTKNPQVEDEVTASFNGRLDRFKSSTPSESRTSSGGRSPLKRLQSSTSDRPRSAASPSPSRSPSKKNGKNYNKYAPPSTYAHLNGIPDHITPGLICIFIGLNPGVSTAVAGHAYAHKSNLFWRMMYWGGLTSRLCEAEEDELLPSEFTLGCTNIVSRPTASQGELSKQEMDDSVAVLEEKIRVNKPEAVCMVGKAIWESVWRAKHGGKNMSKDMFNFGWQKAMRFGPDPAEGYEGARIFVVPSTSGLVAGYTLDFKKNLWIELGAWVNQRRAERTESKDTGNIAETAESSNE